MMNHTMIPTSMDTARRELNVSMTPDESNHTRQPSHEKMLFFERSSEYSDGSALFMM